MVVNKYEKNKYFIFIVSNSVMSVGGIAYLAI
jgi:hypothetical protein